MLEHHVRVLIKQRTLNEFLNFCCELHIFFRDQHLFLPLFAHGTTPPCLINVVQDGVEVKGLDIFFTSPLLKKAHQK